MLNLSKFLKIDFSTVNTNIFNICSGTFQGNRTRNNDIISVKYKDGNYLLLLADGHGGKEISNSVIAKIEYLFDNNINFFDVPYVKKKFILIDKELFKDFSEKNIGTTLTMIYINDKNIISYNLGDSNYLIKSNESSTIISGNVHNFTSNLNEVYRVINSNLNQFKLKKINDKIRLDGKLELSRSFGDFRYKILKKKYNSSLSILCNPECTFCKNNINYILIASDGLFNFIERDCLIKYIENNINIQSLEEIIKQLILKAFYNKSNDNISIILLKCVKKPDI